MKTIDLQQQKKLDQTRKMPNRNRMAERKHKNSDSYVNFKHIKSSKILSLPTIYFSKSSSKFWNVKSTLKH